MNKFARILVILVALCLIARCFIHFSNKGISFTTAFTEVAIYQSHHKPNPGWYYSIEDSSIEGGKTFVIGRNVKPQVGGTVTENGKLIEIEVPTKKVGIKTIGLAKYCIIREIDGVPTVVYLTDERAVVLDALQN